MNKRSFIVEEEEDYTNHDDEPGHLLQDWPREDKPEDIERKRRESLPKPRTRQRKRDKIASILSYSPKSKKEVKEWELKLNAPFTEGPLMDYLLKYSDFWTHTEMLKKSNTRGSIMGDDNASDDVSGDGGKNESQRMDLISKGKVKLNDTRATAMESNTSFSHVVDPMCKLRGMDLFLTDDPQESIWC